MPTHTLVAAILAPLAALARRSAWLLPAAVLLMLGTMAAFGQPKTFTYTNPIPVPGGVRDCQIVLLNGTYYMTGTSKPFFEVYGQNPGVRIWSSTDLLHWKDEGIMVAPSPDHWYKRYFWAPEIFPYKNKFYLTFSCALKTPDGKDGTHIGIAVADHVLGPYQVLSQDEPVVGGNDATLFADDDGQTYLFINSNFAPIDLATGKLLAPMQKTFSSAQPWWEGGLEGFSVMKRLGTYYVFYSSFARGYEVGYATASSVRGPWTKYPGNPIYGAQSKAYAARFHKEYTQSPDVPFDGVGHGSPFFGPDGRLWFCCHGTTTGKGQDPALFITPLVFAPGGSVSAKLTWTPQTVPIPAAAPDPAWRSSGSPASNH